MIKYCNVDIPLPTDAMQAWIDSGVDFDVYKPVPYWAEQTVPPGFYQFPAYQPPPVKIGRWCWPTELNAWSTCYLIMDQDTLDAVVASDGYIDDSSQQNLLVYDDSTDSFSAEMFIHRIHPIAQNAFLLCLVDQRYYRQGNTDITGSYNGTAAPITPDAEDHLKQLAYDALYSTNTYTIGDITSDGIDSAYTNVFTDHYLVHWTDDKRMPGRWDSDTLVTPNDDATPYINSGDATSAHSAIQLAMNTAYMLGQRIVVQPFDGDSDIRLCSSANAASRDASELTAWAGKQRYSKPISTDYNYLVPPPEFRLVGMVFGYAVEGETAVDPGYGPFNWLPHLPALTGQPQHLLIADVDRYYSTNISSSSDTYAVALATQWQDDWIAWHQRFKNDVSYHGVVPFSLHGTVKELVFTHDIDDLWTKVVPFEVYDTCFRSSETPRHTDLIIAGPNVYTTAGLTLDFDNMGVFLPPPQE